MSAQNEVPTEALINSELSKSAPDPHIESRIKQPRSLKDRSIQFWREWIKPLLAVLIVLSTFRSTVADWNDVPTGSMKPTILEGDRILVNKLAYDLKVPFLGWRLAEWSQPERGDVVICYSPADGTRLVKRVIGVPGDRVELRRNHLVVNGERANYDVLDPSILDELDANDRRRHHIAAERTSDRTYPTMIARGPVGEASYGPVVVPKGRYFVLGDNRDNSVDSRVLGFVPRDDIIGRVFGVALSLDREHYYRPRWSRFFRGMP